MAQGQALMLLAVLWLLSRQSWRMVLLLLALQRPGTSRLRWPPRFSAHLNAGYNGAPAERPKEDEGVSLASNEEWQGY